MTEEIAQTSRTDTKCSSQSPSENCAVFLVSHPNSGPTVHLRNCAMIMSRPSATHQSAQLKNFAKMISRLASRPQCNFPYKQPLAADCQFPLGIAQFLLPVSRAANRKFPLGIAQFLLPVSLATNWHFSLGIAQFWLSISRAVPLKNYAIHAC